MIDKFLYNFFAKIDDIIEWIATKLAGKRCQCKKKQQCLNIY